MRVSTASGRPPDSTSSAGEVSSIFTARSIVWPTPMVGSLGPITRSMGMSITDGSREIASISYQLVDRAGDLGVGERGRVLAHRELADVVGLEHVDRVAHGLAGVDVEQLGRVAPRLEHRADAVVALADEAEVRHPLVVEHPGQVAAAGVRVEHDDDVVGSGPPGDLDRGGDGHAAGAADEDALGLRAPAVR